MSHTEGHAPKLTSYSDGTAGIDCDCGWSDPSVWGSKTGAAEAFLVHLVGEAVADLGSQAGEVYDFDVSLRPVG